MQNCSRSFSDLLACNLMICKGMEMCVLDMWTVKILKIIYVSNARQYYSISYDTHCSTIDSMEIQWSTLGTWENVTWEYILRLLLPHGLQASDYHLHASLPLHGFCGAVSLYISTFRYFLNRTYLVHRAGQIFVDITSL